MIRPIAAYVGVVILGLGLHLFGVYSLSVKFFGGMSPRRFFSGSKLAMVTAFSTASSSATLPTALRSPRRTWRFRGTSRDSSHRGLGDEPERDRALRRRHRPVHRAGLRRGALAGAADDDGRALRPGRCRHRGHPRRVVAVRRHGARGGGSPGRRAWADPRRGPPARHVPNERERHRRPRRRGLCRSRRSPSARRSRRAERSRRAGNH